VITQIGACQWHPTHTEHQGIVTNSFEVCVDPVSCQKAGLRIDADTVGWWMDPDRDEPREQWHKTLKFELPLALDGFVEWLTHIEPDPTKRVIWGNGSDFDNVLLANAFKVSQREVPWSFRNNRCFRTLKAMVKEPRGFEPTMSGFTKHTALADALHEAHWANTICRHLNLDI
jgi:hypothetical protein